MSTGALRPASRRPSSMDSCSFFLSLSPSLRSRLKVIASRRLGGGLFAIPAARARRPCCLSSLVRPICKCCPCPPRPPRSSACQPLRNSPRKALPPGSVRTEEVEVVEGWRGGGGWRFWRWGWRGYMKNGGTEERKIKKKMRAAGMGRGAKKKKEKRQRTI